MRPAWPLSALPLLACTPSGPRTEPDETDAEPEALEGDGPGHLQGVHPRGGEAALLSFPNSLALTTCLEGHVVTTRLPEDLAGRMNLAELQLRPLRGPRQAAPRSRPRRRVGALDAPERGKRILQLRRSPTTADLRRFLAGSFPWDPADSFLISATVEPTARAWLVDGSVIDAAWRAATGDAPFWSYPPAVERRN